jgi:hypothetical protein
LSWGVPTVAFARHDGESEYRQRTYAAEQIAHSEDDDECHAVCSNVVLLCHTQSISTPDYQEGTDRTTIYRYEHHPEALLDAATDLEAPRCITIIGVVGLLQLLALVHRLHGKKHPASEGEDPAAAS